jgi:hypothetical protein
MHPAHVAERGVAQLARGRLDAGFGLGEGDPALVEGDPEGGATGPAMLGPGVGIRADAVVDVKGEQRQAVLARVIVRQVQQRG